MLTLVESRRDKISAQKKFAYYLQTAWAQRERRLVVWRPNSKVLNVAHNGSFWFAVVPPRKDQATPRYWNSIGKYQANGGLQISVEINIPIESDSRLVSGFFARDEQTGRIYLMHDGSVGGGRLGIGRESFLAWSGAKLVPVEDSAGKARLGIIVTPIESKRIGVHLASFAQTVFDFKNAVVHSEADRPAAQESKKTYSDYFREFSGKKKGQRAQDFEYISRHGDIVHALSEWRKAHIPSKRGRSIERIVKDAHIDLGIANASGRLTELYEVKTNTDRQTLYTAIGQIKVHEAVGVENLQRFVVLPSHSKIPNDVNRAIKRLKIQILRFDMIDDSVRILE